MRHAKSDWASGAGSDFERPLARRGLKDAPRMGKWLYEHSGTPSCIVCSPARRAAETARLVLAALDYPEDKIVRDDRIYEGCLSDLLCVIKDHKSCKSLLLIGHNPGLEDLLNHLSVNQPPRDQGGKLLTTTAIAILVFKGNKIVTTPGSADIQVIQRPRAASQD